MDVSFVAILIGCLLMLVIGWRSSRSRRRTIRVQGVLPLELAGAKLWCAEKKFVSSAPVALTARVDRAYRTDSGAIVLLEFKTRPRAKVHASDVIELSAQRTAIMLSTHEIVAEYGFVLIGPAGRHASPCLAKVQLLSIDQVAQLVDQRRELLDGSRRPGYAVSHGLCRTCPFAATCEWPMARVRRNA